MRHTRALRKFLFGYAIVHLVVAAIFLFLLTTWLRDRMLDQNRLRMQELCFSVREHVNSLADGMEDPSLLEHLKRLDASTGVRFTLIREDGFVCVDSRTGFEDIGDHGNRPEVIQARQDGLGFNQRTSQTLNVPLMYLALPLFEDQSAFDNRPAGYVRVAVESREVSGTITALQRSLWVFTIGSGLLAALLMVWIASREMRPLQLFAEAARNIASGQYAMLPGIAKRNDEWKSLADAFTVMQSELRQRESTLRENSQRLEAVLGSMIEGVLAVDPARRVLVANQAACDMLNVPLSEMTGSCLTDVVRIPELARAIQHTLTTQRETQTEFETVARPRRILEVRVTPMSNLRAAIVIHDVTDLRNLETMRQDFVANVSHELKTPLASIKAYAETLRMGALDDSENNVAFVEQIEEQAEVLDSQIADLLKLSELESGTSTFDLAVVDTAEALHKCRERFAAEAMKRDLQIVIETPGEGCTLKTDRMALRTILDNLVSNAIRYARPAGEVRLSADYDQGNVVLRVSDNGIGIAEEHRERIFERFYRVDRARSRDLGGTGLGLAIVKHTVNALGGEIKVISKPGQGSTFEVIFLNHAPAES